MRLPTLLLTVLALFAFAGNSLLTRLALGAEEIDATMFATVRLASGGVALGVLALLTRRRRSLWHAAPPRSRPSLAGILALCGYALLFTWAYVRIGAAVGALVLFGSVQLTMLGWACSRGERPSITTWIGMALAVGGLVLLLAPSATRPDPVGALMMVGAGVAWGVYTLLGRGADEPIAANARSFAGSTVIAVVAMLLVRSEVPATTRGIVLATISGAVTSGLGYAIWYRALPRLSVAQAAIAQLTVPVLAAFGAVVWLGEALTTRLVVASIVVLGGVGLAIAARVRPRSATWRRFGARPLARHRPAELLPAMVDSLWQPSGLTTMLARLDSLRPDSPRGWGKMAAAQMLAHCQQPLRVALGELPLKRSLLGLLFGRLAKKKLLAPEPWKPGMPTAPEFRITDTRDFAKEQAALHTLVERFGRGGEAALSKKPHPFFGPLTADEWQQLQWRHLDHHMRQFGA